jgi:hypothetical protein
MKLFWVQSVYSMTLHVPHVQDQAHGEVQEGHEAHQINQHAQEVVLWMHLEVHEVVQG